MPIVELHVHGRPHKHGGNSKLMEIARIAKKQGTDCLVLTEHSHTKDANMWSEDLIQEVEHKHDITIFKGMERTHKKFGHYLDIDNAKVWAHPLDTIRRISTDDMIEACEFFHAMEVVNKRYKMRECLWLMDYAVEWGLHPVGGSDIHLTRHVGICPCWTPTIDDIDCLGEAIAAGDLIPLRFPL
jgi:predicted metal-dependent phosphoesterase TrpH